MNFDFTEEQRMFKDALERVVREKIEPLLASYPRTSRCQGSLCKDPGDSIASWNSWRQGARGIRGSGLGAVGLGIAAETIPYEAFELLMCMEVVALRICMGGSEEMKKKYVPRIMNGEKFAASGTSEPDVGSDRGEFAPRQCSKGSLYPERDEDMGVSRVGSRLPIGRGDDGKR